MARYRLDTLSDFTRQGYNARIRCTACGHVVDANAVALSQDVYRRRASQRIENLERQLRCSNCGVKGQAHVSPVPIEF